MERDILISEAFEKYRVDQIIYLNQSIKTEQLHNATKRQLLSYLGDVVMADLTFEMIRDWKGWLAKRCEANSVQQHLIKLRMVLKYMKLRGFDVIDYEMVGLPKRIDKPPDFLTSDQVAELIEAISKPGKGYAKLNRLANRAMISLFYASGIRASELIGLNRSDIKDDNTFTVFGKGKKYRLCFFDQRTRKFLNEYLGYRDDDSPALFISARTGKRISSSTLQKTFIYARNKTNFEVRLHAHILRHSFATDLLKSNTNMRYVQEFLGHESIVTTQRYSHVVNEDLRKIYADKHTC